ncbi:MAG: restriction endonuclease subunit S [Acidithiobacillus sp.]
MQLQDVCDLIIDCEHKTAPTQETGYPSIRTPNIGRGRFILDGVNRVSEETYRLWTKRAVPLPGDLIMAREAPVGNVAMIPEGLHPCLGQRTLLIRPDRAKVEPSFLNYFLNGPHVQGLIHTKTNGATVAHLNMKDVRTMDLPTLPPLPIQQRIAGILSAYDELIENSQRRIKILESMTRALYREWFVYFRFPGHENHPRIASPLGEIPQGWEVKKLGEIAEDMRRNVPKGQLEAPTSFVGLEHIPRRSLALDAWETVTELGSNKLEFKKGEILFGKIRPYFHKVSIAPFEGLCSADTIVIRALRPEHYAYVVACVSSDAFVAKASATANGAKMPRANWDVLKKYPVVIPKSEVADKFSALIADVIAQQQTLIFQIQNLRRTRDLLLPRLLSGQIILSEEAEIG